MKYTVTLLVEDDHDDPDRLLDEVTSAVMHAVKLDPEAVRADAAVTVEERQGGDPLRPEPIEVSLAFDLIHEEIKERTTNLTARAENLKYAAEYVLDATMPLSHRMSYAFEAVERAKTLANEATRLTMLRDLQRELEKLCGD